MDLVQLHRQLAAQATVAAQWQGEGCPCSTVQSHLPRWLRRHLPQTEVVFDLSPSRQRAAYSHLMQVSGLISSLAPRPRKLTCKLNSTSSRISQVACPTDSERATRLLQMHLWLARPSARLRASLEDLHLLPDDQA